MLKKEELSNPSSCMSRARDDEMTFVLLGRDPAASVAIRAWIEERIRLGKNTRNDQQIMEAEDCAAQMEYRLDALELALERQVIRGEIRDWNRLRLSGE